MQSRGTLRPGRGAHDAMDALLVGVTSKKVNWIIDADIRSFFDTVSQERLIRCVEHRIGDRVPDPKMASGQASWKMGS